MPTAPTVTPHTTALVASAAALLREQRIQLAGERVVACCSGGADSVGLVDVMCSLPRGLRPVEVVVLFADHGLRNVEVDRRASRAIADLHGVEWTERTAPPGSFARNTQAAARDWRLDISASLACDLGARWIATGHHADDTLETLLMGLAGSSGPRALHGIPFSRPLTTRDARITPSLLRPLSQVTRAMIREHLDERGISWAEDPGNADPDASRRSAVRHELMPVLISRFPGAAINVERSRAVLAELSDGADELAGSVLAASAGDAPDSLRIAALRGLADPALRIVVARWLREHGVGRALSTRTIASVIDLIRGPQPNGPRSLQIRAACVRADRYHLAITATPELEDR